MFFTRLVSLMFVYCVVVVHRQALAGGQQRFLTPDETVAVSVTQNQDPATVPSVKSCYRLNGTSSGMKNVRFQEIRVKTASFKRVMLDMKPITWYSDMEIVNASSIKKCADKTFEAGYAGFHFIATVCSMFTPRYQFCRCDAGGSEVIYVQDSFWDAKDRVLPRYVQNDDGDLYGNTRMKNSVIFDQMMSRPNTFFVPFGDWFDMTYTYYPEFQFPVWVNGEMVGATEVLDVESCSIEDCNLPFKYTVHHLINLADEKRSLLTPSIFALSECGKTVTRELTETSAKPFYLMSHKGFGCDWYPKPEEDHTCVVTVDKPSEDTGNTQLRLWLYTAFLDGNNGTAEECAGDFVEVYTGNSTDPENLLRKFDYCTEAGPLDLRIETNPPITFAFTRTAEQHLPKEQTNFGFGFRLVMFNRN